MATMSLKTKFQMNRKGMAWDELSKWVLILIILLIIVVIIAGVAGKFDIDEVLGGRLGWN